MKRSAASPVVVVLLLVVQILASRQPETPLPEGAVARLGMEVSP